MRSDAQVEGSLHLQSATYVSMVEATALGVRQAREDLGWTQAELAVATATLGQRVSLRTVNKVESGDGNWRVSTLEALAEALGTTASGLVLQGEALARRRAVSGRG